MPSCLGIHIEDYVIKYAKVHKEKDNIKVESFNVMFYDDLKSAIKRIINETNSARIPISTNLSGEMYNYFQVSSMLNKQDMKKAVEIDFDLLCEERNYKKNTLETRFLFTPSLENEESMQAIAISGSQGDLAQKKMDFDPFRVANIHPISTSIINLLPNNDESNCIIVNIEEQTKVTLVSNGQVAKIDFIPDGMKDIINKISGVENSNQKAYEVCKNTTIYTQDGAEGVSEGNEHINSIMPTLYSIVTKTKEIIEDSGVNVAKVYITGLGTSINNIDLYFQEHFDKTKCEILKPFFADVTSVKTSIKDYIEVNSAIALALNGIGYGYRELNFSDTKGSAGNLNFNIKEMFKGTGQKSKESFTKKLDAAERMILRIAFVCVVAIAGYMVCATTISKNIDKKSQEVLAATAEVDNQIANANSDINKIKKQTDSYKTAIEDLKSLEENQTKTTKIIKTSAIPNLLYRLVDITPKRVKIVSIQNKAGTDHIIIQAQSEDYEQLGFLKAAITTNSFLLNVKSTSGTKTNGIISTTIEGDLP